MTNEKEISPLVQNVLNNIDKNIYDNEGLKNLYVNTSRYQGITDYEREQLTEKIVGQLRTRFPKQSARMLGNKSTLAQETLTQILEEIKKDFDWTTNNKVGDHVKVGGSMIRGDDFVCWYISYKNEYGVRGGIAFRQYTPEKPPILDLHIHTVGTSGEEDFQKDYPLEQQEQCIEDFKVHLQDIIK